MVDRPKPRLTNRASMTRYYKGSSKADSSPFKKKPPIKISARKKILTRAIDYVVVVLVLFGVLYSLVINPEPKIVATDYSYHTAATYQRAAEAQFKSLKNRTKLTVDEKEISSSMQKQFPEIDSASVGLPIFGQKPILHLFVAAPSFYLVSNGHSYVIDSSGVAVSETRALSALKNSPLVNDQSSFNIKTGSQVLSTNSVSFIRQVIAQCRLSNIPISNFVLPQLAQKLDLHTKDKPYFVKFYLGGNATTQLGQFLAARHQLTSTHQEPSQYLDVRVAGKIYYK